MGAVYPQAQESRRLEVKVSQGTNIAIALSPDKRTIAFDLQGTLWTMPATGGKARAITDELGGAHQPAFSSYGKRIAFQSYRDGNWHIWTIAPDGSQLAQITSGPFDDREPHFSPDGKCILFSSDRGSNYDIWKIDLSTRKLEQLTSDPANDYNPAFSPDGRDLAFVSERKAGRGIWLMNEAMNADGRKERLLSASDATAAAPSWSPDGAYVVYQTFSREKSATELRAKSIASKEEARLISAAGEDVFPFRAAWASNSEFFYTADGQIKKASLVTKGRSAIAFEATVRINRPSYARKKRDFDSTVPRPVLGIVAPAVSPDGGRIAFTALGDLWIQGPDKKARRITDDIYVEAYPAWSRDGTKLAYVSDKQGAMDLWVRDLKTGEAKVLVKSANGVSSPAWSPDGKQIAYVGSESPLASRLQVLDIESGKSRKVLDRPMQPARISWGPGGKSLAFVSLKTFSTRYREGVYEVMIVPIDGGEPRSIKPSAPWTWPYAEWSPDGRMMVFIEDGRLSIAPMNEKGEMTGAPRRINDDLADGPSWSGDSKSLVYLSMDRLKRVYVETGRTEDITPKLEWRREKVAGAMVVHAGRLFDGKSADYQRSVDIVIEGNRIKEIRPHSESLHAGKWIDASDKTVIPGLFEMHTHQNILYGEKLGRMWLAFGITSVREPGTDPYEALESRESWDSGLRPGPREFFAGRPFDGNRNHNPLLESIASDSHLDLALERAKRLDYDLIKTYVRFPDALQKRVVSAAHKMGIPTASHELYPAAAYGMDAVEHIGATSRRGYSLKLSLLSRSYDDVIKILGRSQVDYTPTFVLWGFPILLAKNRDVLKNRQLLELLGEQRVKELANRPSVGPWGSSTPDSVSAQGKTILSALKAGARVMPGTDSPALPFGFSLQLELQSLVQAGLTPFEALRSATLWSAEGVGAGRDLGSIERGKLADMVIVDGDPLQRIEDTLNVAITIKNGRAYLLKDLLTPPR
ncbi:MAG TPA: DPP IV N-terminal domain-containing protein [Blastocatellia bacterium]|nr:DPP IV N-terminal domain-containing protein [Blastocatellia bacterium]